MKMSQQEQLTSYLVAFIHGLQRANITDIVISPGSRSTPLALLFVENKQMDCYINIDGGCYNKLGKLSSGSIT